MNYLVKLMISLALFTYILCADTTENKYENFVFSDADSIFQFKGAVTPEMGQSFVEKVLTYDKKEMYIYFDSPGGSVMASFDMINVMKSSDVKFICFAKFAASAAFTVFQYCTERIMVRTGGILMSHQASIQIGGNITTILRLLTIIQRQIDDVKHEIANRLGMSYEEYDYRVSKDWWFDAKEAIDFNVVDYINHTLSCTKELAQTEIDKKVTKYSIFGPIEVNVTEKACPLLGQ